MTTREKILHLVHELRTTPAASVSGDARDLVEMLQMAEGLGFNIFGQLVPETEAEADLLIDKLTALCFHLRGDDLPPFTLDLYGEAEAEAEA